MPGPLQGQVQRKAISGKGRQDPLRWYRGREVSAPREKKSSSDRCDSSRLLIITTIGTTTAIPTSGSRRSTSRPSTRAARATAARRRTNFAKATRSLLDTAASKSTTRASSAGRIRTGPTRLIVPRGVQFRSTVHCSRILPTQTTTARRRATSRSATSRSGLVLEAARARGAAAAARSARRSHVKVIGSRPIINQRENSMPEK